MLQLTSDKELTKLVKSFGVFTWEELLILIRKLPYGRNSNRNNLSLVLRELKGSCSSKHAFLKAVANENNILQVKLILGMHQMNATNTKIGSTIKNTDLNYIPEAHCYLKINGIRTDVTSENTSFEKIKNVLLEEIEIEPHQVSVFKIEYHKNFIKNWISTKNISKSFEEIWHIRERCIEYLTQHQFN